MRKGRISDVAFEAFHRVAFAMAYLNRIACAATALVWVVLSAPVARSDANGAGSDAIPDAHAKRSLQEAAIWIGRGEPARAEACLDQVSALEAEVGQITPAHVITAKLLRATLAEKRGNFDEARRLLKDAEARLSADAPDTLRLAVLEQQLGWLHVHGELREASLVADEMLSLAELRRDSRLISRYSQECGILLCKLGDLDGAEARATRAVESASEATLQTELARAKKLQGNIASARRQTARASAMYGEALAIFVEVGDRHEAANCHYNLAILLRETEDRAAMRTHLDEAVALFTQAGSLGGVGLCRMFDGQVYLRSGDLLRAAERLEEAERIFSRTQNRFRSGQTKQLLAGLALARGDKSKAAQLENEASHLLGPEAK